MDQKDQDRPRSSLRTLLAKEAARLTGGEPTTVTSNQPRLLAAGPEPTALSLFQLSAEAPCIVGNRAQRGIRRLLLADALSLAS